MSLTSIDPPEVIRFVRQQYPGVELIKPRDSIFNIAVRRQILPTMRVRWCCAEYKENAGAGRVTLIGIRHEESSRRARRNEVEISSRKFSGTLAELDVYRETRATKESKPHRGRKSKAEQITIVNASGERTLGCINGKESLLISPIIHWSEDDVWQFLRVIGATHCSLYDEGWHRIGCICCPMSSVKQKREEEKRWPHVKRGWIKAIRTIRAGGYLPTHISGGTSASPPGSVTPPQQVLRSSRPSTSTRRTSGERINRGLWSGFQIAHPLSA